MIVALMLVAFALVGQRIWQVGSGPRLPSPGDVAPAFVAPVLSGGELSLEKHRGRVVLLDFWATWCPPCVAAMPSLQRMHDKHRAAGLDVIGVNIEREAVDRVRRFVAARKLTFPVVIDPGTIAPAYGVYSYPSSVLLDRDGVVRRVHRGVVAEAVLDAEIRSLLGSGSKP